MWRRESTTATRVLTAIPTRNIPDSEGKVPVDACGRYDHPGTYLFLGSQRFNKPQAFFEATAWMYLTYEIGRWGVQEAKRVVAIGGFGV